MAEAIKTTKTEKIKPSTSEKNHARSEEEITDKSLESRLKSLTSFINNIEPTPKAEEKSQKIVKNDLKPLALAPPEPIPLLPTAPPIVEKFEITHHEAVKEPLKTPRQNNMFVPIVRSPVTDFNMEKIKLVNKLNYPRLCWNSKTKLKNQNNQQFRISLNEKTLEPEFLIKNLEIDEECMRFFEKDQLCKELEVYYKCKHIQSKIYDSFLDDFIRNHSNLIEFKYEKTVTEPGNNQQQMDEFKHNFFELVKDYYEARLLVKKCTRNMNEFKWQCLNNQMRAIWSFEKYTIESNAVCGDQQRVKHELTSEKAYLNKIELTKLQTDLYDLRLNLIKSGLVSSQFCSKLAKVKLESYLHDFFSRVREVHQTKNGGQVSKVASVCTEIKILIDILFYFSRKKSKPSAKILNSLNERKKNGADDDGATIYDKIKKDNNKQKEEEDLFDQNQASSMNDEQNDLNNKVESDNDESDIDHADEFLTQDMNEWLRCLIIALLNISEHFRQRELISKSPNVQNINSPLYQHTTLHFENIFFLLQHMLRSPCSYATTYSYLFQVPLLSISKQLDLANQFDCLLTEKQVASTDIPTVSQQSLFLNLNLNNSYSDQFIKLYLDFYLKLLSSFSYEPKYRRQFLFINTNTTSTDQTELNFLEQDQSQQLKSSQWELIDSDGDLETIEQTLIDISEDDVVKLYYQIPFNGIFSFLWSYLNFQNESNNVNSKKTAVPGPSEGSSDFRKRHVSMKIISFLDHLTRLCIRSLLVYNRSKYKNFSKLIGKTLKESMCFASLICTQLNAEDTFLIHYDNFVKRIFTTLIYSNRCRIIRWTILSQLNLSELCLRTKWAILSIMCGIDVFHENFEHLFHASASLKHGQEEPKPQDYVEQACKNDLENLISNAEDCHKLLDMELLSFIRTLHFLVDVSSQSENMKLDDSGEDSDFFEDDYSNPDLIKINNNDQEKSTNLFPGSFTAKFDSINSQNNKNKDDDDLFEFMKCVVKVIFKIAYCYEKTREVCCKDGNSLLFAICSKHPNLIGTIMNEIDLNLDKIGKKALYLVNELPFNKWLPYVDCKTDINFLIKCFLQTATNSILFYTAVTCIDNIDFKQNTQLLSHNLIRKWQLKNNKTSIYNGECIFVDLSRMVQIKLAITLFELHMRLTVYQYFNKTATESIVDKNTISLEDLSKHYLNLAKEKRLSLVTWIWNTISRMNIFIDTTRSHSLVESLERYSSIYCQTSASITSTQQVINSHLNGLLTQIVFGTVIDSKCPLEKYLNLMFTSSRDLEHTIQRSVELIHSVLNTHNKKSQLQELAYSVVFNWFENLIFKYSTIKLKRRLNSCSKFQPKHQDSWNHLSEFRACKRNNQQKFSTIMLIIFNPNTVNSNNVIEGYCELIIKRLDKFNSIKFDESMPEPANDHQGIQFHKNFIQQQEHQRILNYHNYLYLWIEILISSIRNWHKYKNIVKLVDFLTSYTFNSETTPRIERLNKAFINSDLLDEFMSYVRIDFGVIAPSADYSQAEQQRSPTPSISSETENNSNETISQILTPFNWLSSSFYTVVNNTTTQLSGTVTAAIQAVNSSYSLSSSEFDSTQLQQFTYDKRLYKEFPYVGFYLSLCEERLEAQLSLWSTFRSYLLGLNEFSSSLLNESNMKSQSFIDSCWRKTIQSINKIHGLSLNFPYQRLMLFKWCERALELPHDHPLLILYWQKFFNIYLDKDFYSSLSNISPQLSVNIRQEESFDLELTPTSYDSQSERIADLSNQVSGVKSPTLKLFTSTSHFNSLLKHMKKQLELTSEYFAYRCHNNGQSTSISMASAPVSDYHYNETMSKLYYAFSLWTDETRLHDSNLYIPALPAHYEPDLIAKIFSKQTDLWTQFVDLTQLYDQIELIIKKTSNRSKDHKRTRSSFSYQSSSKIHEFFFQQEDRLVFEMPSLEEIGVKFKCALTEKYGSSLDSLLKVEASISSSVPSSSSSASQFAYTMSSNQKEQIQLVVNISEHLIRNIFKYNKEMINSTLNHMLKQDDKLINKLIVHLWSNEVCEKYVQVPCTSLLNPMHQCSRPAMIKFVYELATKRDQFKQEIKENRFNYEKLLSNFADTGYNRSTTAANRFPHDEIIKSMVAMNQLIKRLLRNHHFYQQTASSANTGTSATSQSNSNNQLLLTRLFYLFVDMYETLMHHPNDILNSLNNSILRKPSRHQQTNPEQPASNDWHLLIQTNSNIDPMSTLTEQHMASDSVHLYMFDLIHLIGTSFIQTNISIGSREIAISNQTLMKRNQQILLEKIIQKLTSTVQQATNSSASDMHQTNRITSSSNSSSNSLANTTGGSSNNNNSVSIQNTTSHSSSSSSRRSFNILLNLTRNKLSLMSLCAQYVEPNDLDLFNEFYTNILCSITSILLNINYNMVNSPDQSQQLQISGSFDSLEIINLKFSIILQLLSKFSFVHLNKLIDESCKNYEDQVLNDNITDVCCRFVDTNFNFLIDLKLSPNSSENQVIMDEKNLRLIIDQCIDNYVSILNIDYPFYFEFLLKKCLEFSSKSLTLKYGCRHLNQFNMIMQQRELMFNSDSRLDKSKIEETFKFFEDFFEFERAKFISQKLSFYSHWFAYARNINQIYTSLFTLYLDRFCINDFVKIDYSGVVHDELVPMLMNQFKSKYNKFWDLILRVYSVWIEPASIKELTSQSVINVTEAYEYEIKKGAFTNTSVLTKNPGCAVVIMLNSFLNLFNLVVERLMLFINVNNKPELNELCTSMHENSRNYVLNKFFHFYYEKISSILISSSSINDNTQDCYHRCISKYTPGWFENGRFEPDYQSINIMNEICFSSNTRQLKFLAFDIVAYLDLARITESYFRKQEIIPQQINDLLKCWFQLLTEFCLRDSIRESKQFDTLLRPIYNQAEVLQSWSMLSDTSYMDVVMNKFCQSADYHYVFASRGTDRGLLMNLLKSSAEFNSLADRNLLSCFSSAKRRCYLKAVCQILLKPSFTTINNEQENFQNCIMNLLTDLETFSISSQNDSTSNKFLKHEIKLLIDECIVLVTGQDESDVLVTNMYCKMFESWLSSSRDSPILIHFINRFSRSLSEKLSSPDYLLELCIQVFFETDHGHTEVQMNESTDRIFPDMQPIKTLSSNSQGWQEIMSNIEFKLNFSGYEYQASTGEILNPNCYLLEYKFLENSNFLILYAYMSQRFAMFQASYSSEQLNDIMLNYTSQIISRFEASNKASVTQPSKPLAENEEKFCLVLNYLLDIYKFLSEKSNKKCQDKIGEHLVRISGLLIFYGEDVLSNQNPINNGQSISSDLLSSIGLSILSQKSPFSFKFRVYCRCLAVGILKKINLLDGIYTLNNVNDTEGMANFSVSPGRFNPSETNRQLIFNQQLKQAAYQYHLIFQNKSYASNVRNLIEIGALVNQYLENKEEIKFGLSRLIEFNKEIERILFHDNYYLD